MLYFRSEGNEEEGRPATANPPCRAGQPRPAGCSQGPPARGQPLAGAAARKQAVGYGRDASRKAAYGQKHRPLPTASPRRGRRGSACPWPAHRGATPV
ncbi:hypothetical protein GW17_00058390 [Ensete ventricosum]|nr:hypothetical protein GW17_00058390 [Ensete ventricosum]